MYKCNNVSYGKMCSQICGNRNEKEYHIEMLFIFFRMIPLDICDYLCYYIIIICSTVK